METTGDLDRSLLSVAWGRREEAGGRQSGQREGTKMGSAAGRLEEDIQSLA